jgi:hypothetical protein
MDAMHGCCTQTDLEHRVSEMGVSEYQRRDQRLLDKTAGAWLPSWLSTLDEISKIAWAVLDLNQ